MAHTHRSGDYQRGLPAGTLVRLDGLIKKELNGEEGDVIKWWRIKDATRFERVDMGNCC